MDGCRSATGESKNQGEQQYNYGQAYHWLLGLAELVFLPRAAAYRNWDPTEGRRVRKNQVGGFAGLSPGNGSAVGCWHIKTCIFGSIRKLEKNGLEIKQGAEKSSRNLRKL